MRNDNLHSNKLRLKRGNALDTLLCIKFTFQ